MKITISDKKKISAIQRDFSELFPYLKLEFFSRPHRPGAASPKKLMMPSGKTIGQSRTGHRSGSVTIVPSMTVADLEQQFGERYGLSVQVFRQSGTVWLETTITDQWTLEEQNRQGEALSAHLRKKAASL